MNVTCSSNSECCAILNSRCVFYEGAALPASGIATNDSLQTVVQKLNDAIGSGGGGVGSVTSVGDLSPLFTTANPTTTPTFTAIDQNANLVYAGPTTGIAAAPTFRSLVAADLPSNSGAYWKTAGTSTLTAHTIISGAFDLTFTGLDNFNIQANNHSAITIDGGSNFTITTSGGNVVINPGLAFSLSANNNVTLSSVTGSVSLVAATDILLQPTGVLKLMASSTVGYVWTASGVDGSGGWAPAGGGGGGVTSVTGTTNRITSTGGATPVIDIDASYVGQVSITTLGTIGTGTWGASVIGPAFGGTGIANNAASTLTITGNFATTLTITGVTGVTLPTTGTLATLAGAESLTNKKLGSLVTNGFVKTSAGDGTLSVDTNTYIVTGAAWLLAGTSTFTSAVNIVGTSTNTLKHTFDGLGVTQANGAGIWMANNTAAALGAQQISPSLVWEGQGRETTGSTSQSVKYLTEVLPVQGTTASGLWRLRYSFNAAAYTTVVSVDSTSLTLTATAGTYFTSSSLGVTTFSIAGGNTVARINGQGLPALQLGGNTNGLNPITNDGVTPTLGVTSFGLSYRAMGGVAAAGANALHSFLYSGAAIGNWAGVYKQIWISQLVASTIAPTTGTGGWTGIELANTFNITAAAIGVITGIYYNPTLTSMTGISAHYAWKSSSGSVLIGNAAANTLTANARLEVYGTGTTTGLTLLLEDSTGADRFGFTDAGVMFMYVIPANDNALTQVLVRDSATGEIKYRTSASLAGGTSAGANNEVQTSDGAGGFVASKLIFDETTGNMTLGDSGLAGASRSITAAGSGSNIGLILSAKGSGAVQLNDVVNIYSISSGLHVLTINMSNGIIRPTKGTATSQELVLEGFTGISGSVDGTNLKLTGGNAFATGNNNGGGVYLDSGAINGSGLYSNVALFMTPTHATWQKAFFIGNVVAESTAVTDGIVLYSKNSSDGTVNSTLALYTEQAPEATATFTQTHRIKVWWNNVEFWMSLDAV